MPADKPWYKSRTEWSAAIIFATVTLYTLGYITPATAVKIGVAASAFGLHGVRKAIGNLINNK